MEIRPIPGYAPYCIREDGEVPKIVGEGFLYHNWGGRERLRYRFVQIWFLGRPKKLSVARLVHITFIGSIPEGMHVDHIDGDPLNNHWTNLRVLTPSENMARKGFQIGKVENLSAYEPDLEY